MPPLHGSKRDQHRQKLPETITTKSEGTSSSESIPQASLVLFNRLCRMLPDSPFNSLTDVLLDGRFRFRLWGTKSGVLSPKGSGKASNAGERGQSDLQHEVSLFALERLSANLKRASDIVEFKRPNRCNDALQDVSTTALAELTYRVVRSALYNPNREKATLSNSIRDTTTELAESLIGIHGAITHLLQVCSPNRPRLGKNATEPVMPRGLHEVDGRPDITNITDKFPLLRQRLWLADRLGGLVAQRRAHIRYRQNNRGPEEHGVEGAVSTDPSDARSLAFSEGVPTDSGYGSQGTPSIRTFQSDATSFATTVGPSGNTVRSIPSLTSLCLDGKRLGYGAYIECPYCRTLQIFRNKQRWIEHVYSDLSLYVCTFPECSERAFTTSHDWFHHEVSKHRKQWQCHLCDLPCASAQELGAHFDAEHQFDILDNQKNDLIDLCEIPAHHFTEGSCPFCENWNPSDSPASANLKQFRSHLGSHLREIAREAIPIAIEGLEVVEDEEDDEVSSSSSDEASSDDSSGDEHDKDDQEEPVSKSEPDEETGLQERKEPPRSASAAGQAPTMDMDHVDPEAMQPETPDDGEHARKQYPERENPHSNLGFELLGGVDIPPDEDGFSEPEGGL